VARFDRTIPPGGEGKIAMEVRTRGYEGDFHKTARVFTNDAKNPQVIIAMKGKVWIPIQVTPRRVYLQGTLGDKIEQVVDLQAKKKEPLSLELVSSPTPDKVEVKLHEIEKGRSYQLKIINKAREEGIYAGQVKLTSNYPEKPEIVIPFSGHVGAPVVVRPKELNFGRMSEEELQKLAAKNGLLSRSVMVILAKGTDLKIRKLALGKSLFKVVTNEVQPGRTVRLDIEAILEKLEKGQNTDCLKIHTNQKNHKVLEVPIRFEIF
jgi:hypothetical protein